MDQTTPLRRFRVLFAAAILLASASGLYGQGVPAFTQVIIFGDSLSDTGNIRQRLEDDYFISYPGGEYNYSDGRFTNSSDTDPNSGTYAGTWHEQLARDFLGLAASHQQPRWRNQLRLWRRDDRRRNDARRPSFPIPIRLSAANSA